MPLSNPNNPDELRQASPSGRAVNAATAAVLLGGLALYGDQARAAMPSVGTATEVADVNTSDDEYHMVELSSGNLAFIRGAMGSSTKPMIIDPSATTPTASDVCGSGTYGTNAFTSVTSLDLASSGTLAFYVPSDWSGNTHIEATDTSTGTDYSSCSTSNITALSGVAAGYTLSYAYGDGTIDETTWNGSDNDVTLDDGTVLSGSGSGEQTNPGACDGTDYVFMQDGEGTSAKIQVYDRTDSTSLTDAVSDGTYGWGFPRCQGSTLYMSRWDGTSWDIYEATITFPTPVVDNDGDGYDSTEDCDDDDPNVYPGAPADYSDGKDTDCDDNADTPEWTSVEVNGQVVEDGATIYAEVGELLTFSGVGKDEETLSTDLVIDYEMTGDVGVELAAPYKMTGTSGDTFEFTPTEQGTINVVVTLTDSDGNLQVLEFAVTSGVSAEDLTEGEEIEEGTIIVGGEREGVTTVETTGVTLEDGIITIQDGRVSFSGTPDTTYAALDSDGETVAFTLITEPNVVTNTDGWLAAGISARGGLYATATGTPPPSTESSYGQYSDNENEDAQFVIYTNNGFDVWGTNLNSTTGALELDESIGATSDGINQEVYASDKVDTDESAEEPVDTGEPGDTGQPDDTDEPDDTEQPDDTDQPPANTNESGNGTSNTNTPGGCSTTGSEAPSKTGWIAAGLGLLGLYRRRRRD